MSRRKKKARTEIFSTSLLDMLFCAFGAMFVLFVIGAAVMSQISLDKMVLLTAEIRFDQAKIKGLPDNQKEKGFIKNYTAGSYIAFGLKDQYVDEIPGRRVSGLNAIAHYGYLNVLSAIDSSRTTSMLLPNGLPATLNKINIYPENLRILPRSLLDNFLKDSVDIQLKLYLSGKLFIDSGQDFRVSIDSLYKYQMPRKKYPLLEPLFSVSVQKNDGNGLVFEKR